MGRNTDGSVYHRINGKSIREHRLVWEQYYNVTLGPHEQIGHKNGKMDDNRIENLYKVTKRQRSSHFGKWAEPIPEDRRCMSCGSSKTRIEKDGREHWFKKRGGHLCDKCRDKERARRHWVAFEKQNKCRLLSWAEVRQKNGIESDISKDNLEAHCKGRFGRLVRQIPEDRRCMKCGASKTRAYPYPNWRKRDGGYICLPCCEKDSQLDHYKAGDIDDDMSISNFVKNPNGGPRQCARCGSKTTRRRSKNRGGGPDWCRWGDPGDDLWQCTRCYRYKGPGAPPPKRKKLSEAEKMARKKLSRDKYNVLRRLRRSRQSMREPPKPPKRCIECGSYRTRKNFRGDPNWYNVGERETAGRLYHCNNCNTRMVRHAKANQRET